MISKVCVLMAASIVAIAVWPAALGEDDKYRRKYRIMTFATVGKDTSEQERLVVYDGRLSLSRPVAVEEEYCIWDIDVDRTVDASNPRRSQISLAFGEQLYIGYDVAGKDTAARMTEDHRDKGAQWLRMPMKGGGFGLSPAHGPLKGYYLDFEKPEKLVVHFPGLAFETTVYISKARLSKKPGERSRLAAELAGER